MEKDCWTALSDYHLLPALPGLYIIKNCSTGKEYVGKSLNVRERIKAHRNLVRKPTYIHRALAKYGLAEFQCCLYISGANLTEQELLRLEAELIAERNSLAPSGYNMTEGGEGISGYKHTQEYRKWQSETTKGIPKSEEIKAKLALANQSRVWTDEDRQRVSNTHKGKVTSEETRLKMAKAATGRVSSQRKSIKICVGSFQRVFESVQSAAGYLEVSQTAVSEWLKGTARFPTTLWDNLPDGSLKRNTKQRASKFDMADPSKHVTYL